MTVLPRILDPVTEREPIVKKLIRAAVKDLKPRNESSLKPLLQLVCGLYAFERFQDILDIVDYVKSQPTGKLSEEHLWQQRARLQMLLSIEARVLREAGKPALASQTMKLAEETGGYQRPIGLSDAEFLYESAQKKMTKRKEEEWRVEMLSLLSLAIECGGSKSLTQDQAEAEFQMHLANLRAILKIPQEQDPQRTSKNTANYPIKSLLFAPDYVPGSRSFRSYYCEAGHFRLGSRNMSGHEDACPDCSSEPPRTEFHYKALAAEWGFSWRDKSLPKNTSIKTTWACQDGHTWLATYNDVRSGKSRECSECWKSKLLQQLNF